MMYLILLLHYRLAASRLPHSQARKPAAFGARAASLGGRSIQLQESQIPGRQFLRCVTLHAHLRSVRLAPRQVSLDAERLARGLYRLVLPVLNSNYGGTAVGLVVNVAVEARRLVRPELMHLL